MAWVRTATNASCSGARARACGRVAGGHAGEPQPTSQMLPAAVARPVVAQERPLQLDAQPLGTKGIPQPAQGHLVLDAVPGTAAQADEALAASEHVPKPHPRFSRRRSRPPLTRQAVRLGEDPAEVRPAARIGDEQREMAKLARSTLSASGLA